jgi:hypothetical protein
MESQSRNQFIESVITSVLQGDFVVLEDFGFLGVKMFGFRNKRFILELYLDGQPYDQFNFFTDHVVGELASLLDIVGMNDPNDIHIDIICSRKNTTIQQIIVDKRNSVNLLLLDQEYSGSYGSKQEARNFVFAYLGTFLGSHFPDKGRCFKL